MTPDIRTVRNRLAALRTVVAGNMHRNQWLALALLDGIDTALGPDTPTPEEIEEAYVERHVCVVLPLRKPSGMVRDLLLPELP